MSDVEYGAKMQALIFKGAMILHFGSYDSGTFGRLNHDGTNAKLKKVEEEILSLAICRCLIKNPSIVWC